MIALVLPLKDFIHAKQRLSGVLTANERHNLFQAMVEDILLQVSLCVEISKVLIVSNEKVAEFLAEKYDFYCLSETSKGLNAAVSQARQVLLSEPEYSDVKKMLVVHGDLPLLNQESLKHFIECHDTDLAIATDFQGLGTNAMLLPVLSNIAFQYGENSCYKHLNQAEENLLTHKFSCIPALALDIDEPHDLLTLVQVLEKNSALAPKTAEYLNESTIAKRIGHLELEPTTGFNPSMLGALNQSITMKKAKNLGVVHG